MRRGVLYICLVITLLSLTACNKRKESLHTKGIETNTILIRDDGVIQSAHVDEFDEPYYDKEELRTFMDKEINRYNEKKNEEAVVLIEYQVADQKAKVVLEYTNLEVYSEFNHIEARWLTPEEANEAMEIPSLLTTVKEGDKVDKKEVLKDDYKVLVLNESLDVRLAGKIKAFYNCILLNDMSVQTGDKDMSVIIYQ